MLALRPSPLALSSPASTAARPAQNCSNIRLLDIFEHQPGPPYKARSKTGLFSNGRTPAPQQTYHPSRDLTGRRHPGVEAEANHTTPYIHHGAHDASY